MVNEKTKQVVSNFNNNIKNYNLDTTISDIFEKAVKKYEKKIACYYIDEIITYSELNKLANRIAHWIISHKLVGNKIVGVMMKRSIEMEATLLGILKSGNAYMPIGVDFPIDRTLYMANDGEIEVLIVNYYDEKIEDISKNGVNVIHISKILEEEKKEDNPSIKKASSDLMYVLYTSGSTGRPKGVMIHNDSVINRLCWMVEHYNFNETDVILQKTPYTFDVSVWELFGWFFQGGKLCLLEHNMQRDPYAIVETIKTRDVTIMHFVPSMLEVFLEVLDEEQIKQLKTLKYVFSSGEVLRSSQVKKFNLLLYEANKTKIINLYGPTEATIDVTYYDDCYLGSNKKSIPIGKAISNVRLYIVNEENEQVPIGKKGELCIAGISLAEGYINDEEKTKNKFLKIEVMPGIKERVYKTGDICRYLENGNIEYIGRNDNQVKIHGIRIELGEIEECLCNIDDVTEAAVITEEERGQKQIIAYVVSTLSEKKIKEQLSLKLTKIMIPRHIYFVDKMPVNMHGKLDRKQLKDVYLNKKNDRIMIPEKERTLILEEKSKIELFNIWREILGINEIDERDDFFQIGGDSIIAIQLVLKINEKFCVDVKLSDVFIYSVFRDMNDFIIELRSNILDYVTEENIDNKNDELSEYPITFAQSNIYYASKMHCGTEYNMPFITIIDSEVDICEIKSIVEKLVSMHDSLRYYFIEREDKVYFKIENNLNIDIQEIEGNSDNVDDIIKENIVPFNLEQAPLFRVRKIVVSNGKNYLFFDIHHIITDGISNKILQTEFFELLEYKVISNKVSSYKQYAIWQQNYCTKELIEKSQNYWLNVYKDGVSFIEYHSDIKRESSAAHESARATYVLKRDILDKVNTMCIKSKCTPFIFFYVVYTIMLSKITNQKEVISATTFSNRDNIDHQYTIGMFAHTLPIKLNINFDLTFEQYVNEVRTNLIDAMEHQYLQMTWLAKKLAENSSFKKINFLYTMFSYMNVDKNNIIHDSNTNIFGTAKYDMAFEIINCGELCVLNIDYDTSLYYRSTIDRYFNMYSNIINQAISNISEKIRNLQVFDKTIDVLKEKVDLIDVIYSYARDIPHKMAYCGKKSVTYLELFSEVDRVYAGLQKCISIDNSVIGIYMDLGYNLLVTLLALIKSGKNIVFFVGDLVESEIDDGYQLGSECNVCITDKQLCKEDNDKFNIVYFNEIGDRESCDLEKYERSNVESIITIYKVDKEKLHRFDLTQNQLLNKLVEISDLLNDVKQFKIPLFKCENMDDVLVEILLPLITGGYIIDCNNINEASKYGANLIMSSDSSIYFHLEELEANVIQYNCIKYLVYTGYNFYFSYFKKFEKAVANMYDIKLMVLNKNIYTAFYNMYCDSVNSGTCIWKLLKNYSVQVKDEFNNVLPRNIIGYLNIYDVTQNNNKVELEQLDLGYMDNLNHIIVTTRFNERKGNAINEINIHSLLEFFYDISGIIKVDCIYNEVNQILLTVIYDQKYDLKIIKNNIKMSIPWFFIPKKIIYIDSITANSFGSEERDDNKYAQKSKKRYTHSISSVENMVENFVKTFIGKKVNHEVDLIEEYDVDSLAYIRIVSNIKRYYNVELKMEEFYSNSSVEKLSQLIFDKVNHMDVE